MVVHPAHESCERTANIYRRSAVSTRRRVFIAETAGVDLEAPTAEAFAAEIDAIDDAGSFTIRGGPRARSPRSIRWATKIGPPQHFSFSRTNRRGRRHHISPPRTCQTVALVFESWWTKNLASRRKRNVARPWRSTISAPKPARKTPCGARRLFAIGQLYEVRAPDDDTEKLCWAIDGHTSLVAEVATALGVSRCSGRPPGQDGNRSLYEAPTGPPHREERAGWTTACSHPSCPAPS